jgi:hypothetical protein
MLLSQTTVQHITNLELLTDKVKANCKEYDQQVTDLLKDVNHVIPQDGGLQLWTVQNCTAYKLRTWQKSMQHGAIQW